MGIDLMVKLHVFSEELDACLQVFWFYKLSSQLTALSKKLESSSIYHVVASSLKQQTV